MDTTKTVADAMTFDADWRTIVIIIVLAGAIGGLANFFNDEANAQFSKFKFTKSILLGLVASFTIPLFLQMISSDLIDKPQIPLFNYFVFAGFCIVAAVFSNRFLDSLSQKVIEKVEQASQDAAEAKQNAHEAKQNADEAQDKADTILENDPKVEKPAPEMVLESASQPAKHPVLDAIGKSDFNFRTLDGIAKETNIPVTQLSTQIKDLQDKGLVKGVKTKDGKELFSLSKGSKGDVSG